MQGRVRVGVRLMVGARVSVRVRVGFRGRGRVRIRDQLVDQHGRGQCGQQRA